MDTGSNFELKLIRSIVRHIRESLSDTKNEQKDHVLSFTKLHCLPIFYIANATVTTAKKLQMNLSREFIFCEIITEMS